MYSRQLLTIVLMVALAMVALPGAALSAEPVVVQFGVWNQAAVDRALQQAEAFYAKYPQSGIKIDVVIISNQAESYILHGVSGTLPDVVFVDWRSGTELAQNNLFADLIPYFERDGVNLGHFNATYVATRTVNGALPTVPMGGFGDEGFPMTAINEDLFLAAGLTIPTLGSWNWDQAREAARRLTVDRNGDGNPDQWGIQTGLTSDILWRSILYTYGGRIASTDYTRSELDSPQATDAFQLLQDLQNVDRVIGGNFNNGTAGMRIGARSLAYQALGLGGNPVSEAGFNVGFVEFPSGPAGPLRYRYESHSLAITAGSRVQDAAWTWLKFILTEPESIVPPIGSAQTVSYMPLASSYADIVVPHQPSEYRANYWPMIEHQNFTVGWYEELFDQFGGAYTDLLRVVSQPLQQLTQGQISAREAALTMKDQVEVVLRDHF